MPAKKNFVKDQVGYAYDCAMLLWHLSPDQKNRFFWSRLFIKTISDLKLLIIEQVF